jgi:hypothetical protein
MKSDMKNGDLIMGMMVPEVVENYPGFGSSSEENDTLVKWGV